MPITLSQTDSAFQINNDISIGLFENNVSSVSVNSLSIGSTGIVNYVPYVIQSGGVNTTLITQSGGVVIYNVSGSTSSTSVTTPFNNNAKTDLLPIGTYYLVGSVDVSFNSAATVTSWGVFFDTSSNLSAANTLGSAYSISKNFVLNATTGITSATKIKKQTTLVVNLTTPTIIYLNYYAKSTVAFTAFSTIVATRIG